METKTYKIGEDTYYQKPIVIGQVRQLSEALKDFKFNAADPFSIVKSLGENLYKCIAIVLIKEGQPLKDKKIDELAESLEWKIGIEQAVEIVTDFFIINPISSHAQKIGEAFNQIGRTASTGQLSPFAGETLPKEKK